MDEIFITTYTYDISLSVLVPQYIEAVSKFLAYMKKLVPKPHLKECGSYLTQYQENWITLICDILKSVDHKTINCTELDLKLPYNQLMDALNIPKHYVHENAYYKNIWGPIYWNFLHFTSILCSKNENLRDRFSTNMLNFNLCMICPNCAFNFKNKNPFKLMMIMSISNDTITPMFNLHNIVNSALHKPQYPFEQFLKNYNISASNPQKISLKFIDF